MVWVPGWVFGLPVRARHEHEVIGKKQEINRQIIDKYHQITDNNRHISANGRQKQTINR